MQVHRLKKKHRSLIVKSFNQRQRPQSRKKKLEQLSIHLKEHVSGAKYDFIMMQVKAMGKKPAGMRWTYKDKALALTLLHSSPKTYRLLRKVFQLPSVKTLKLVMRNVNVYPGFNTTILEALRLKLKSPEDKLVTLVLDEMSIKEAITYDQRRDVMEGFSDHVAKTPEIANHALAFMIRGIQSKWKQPIGYFLSSGPICGKDLKELLMKALDLLKEIGVTVLVIVCDQGSNNQNLYKHLGATVECPFFHHQGQQVLAMFDPPHLIKNVRNNLKTHGFELDGHDILWDHVKAFYNVDSAQPVRMAPKLTKRHINLPPFMKLRVSLATQTLSHSVAAGMSVMVNWKIIPQEASYTADFIEKFDQLFNCFNSRTEKCSAKMRHAYTATSGHTEHLQNAKEWLSKLKSKGPRELPCLRGWLMAINCLLLLWEKLKAFNVQSLLTSRINQDCVENLFSVVRAKGGQRDNPNASQFRAAIQQVMVDSVMVSGQSANCLEDVDYFLVNLKNINVMSSKASPSLKEALPVTSTVELPQSVKQILDFGPGQSCLADHDTNVLAYIGGYILKKLQHRVCNECYSKALASEFGQQHQFLQAKNISDCRTGLTFPSVAFTTLIEEMELAYRAEIEFCILGDNVRMMLSSKMSKQVNMDLFKCSECSTELMILHLFINIRLHHTIRENNLLLRDESSRKNRKTLKFSHK